VCKKKKKNKVKEAKVFHNSSIAKRTQEENNIIGIAG